MVSTSRFLVCFCSAERIFGTCIKGSQLEVAAGLVSALSSRIMGGVHKFVDAASRT